MLTCKEITEGATDHVEGRLSISGRLGFFAHMAMCRFCRAYMRQMRATIGVLKGIPRESAGPPPAVLAAFAAYRPATDRKETQIASPWWPKWIGQKTAMVFAAVVPAVSAVLALGVEQVPGPALPLGAGVRCLGEELLAGLLPLAAVFSLARARHVWLPAAGYAAVAAAGALAAQAMLHLSCPADGWRVHMLGFHLGGVLVALALGALAARWQPLRAS